MLRYESSKPSTAAKCPAASRHPRGYMAAIWTLAMTAKEPDTLVMVTLGGWFPAHRARRHATTGDEVTGSSRERLIGWQRPDPRKEVTQPPGTATSVREPNLHLPQPDLFFLDEPAPGLDEITVDPDRPVVVVFGARDCVLPLIAGAQLVRCSDPVLAWRYAMTTSTGRIGPGYAVVDAAGQLRYLTHDVAPGERGERIQRLINALNESG